MSDAERETEAALRRLCPTPAAGVDPIAIAFAAGAASARRSVYAWRGIAALLAVALGTIVMLTARSTDPRPTVVAEAPTIRLATNEPRSRTGDYVRLRERVLDHGLDALRLPAHAKQTNNTPVPRAGDSTWRPL